MEKKAEEALATVVELRLQAEMEVAKKRDEYIRAEQLLERLKATAEWIVAANNREVRRENALKVAGE